MRLGTIFNGPAARIPQLDVLRGIAILMVLGHHTTVDYASCRFLKPLGWGFLNLGWSGVDLFFVLSGFLIGGLLFKEIIKSGDLRAGRFIIRRALKIWPAYYVFVAFSLIKLIHHGHPWKAALSEIVPNLLHFQNYRAAAWGYDPTLMGHTWSLAVEEHFYLALPLILLLCLWGTGRRVSSIPAIPYITAFTCVGCLAFRCIRQTLWHEEVFQTFVTENRVDSLVFGVFLAYIHYFRPDIQKKLDPYRWAFLAIGCLLLVPLLIVTSDQFKHSVGFTLCYLGYGAILWAMLAVKPGEGIFGNVLTKLALRAAAFVGLFSYSIYLWHIDLASWPIDHMFRSHGFELNTDSTYGAFLLVYIGTAICVGILASLLVERPVLWLRDRWWPAEVPPTRILNVPSATVTEAVG